MFLLNTKKIELKLHILRVDSILEHEETVPELAEKLSMEFKNWSNLKDPIIVDKNRIALDGNHRIAVFKKLKIKYIPVCEIDYFNESVRLRYWFRVFKHIKNPDLILRIVEEMQGSLKEFNNKEDLEKQIEQVKFSFGIRHGNRLALITLPLEIVNDAVSAYNALKKIETRLEKKGFKTEYIDCGSIKKERVLLKKDDLVILTPKLSKEMVVESAVNKKVFAPKTTRHLVPARPLNVSVPIFLLREDMSLGRINEKFLEHLKKKTIKQLGPGQIINGRYYEEELFIFY